MDPYLERHWPDLHAKLIAYAADDLNQRLPEDLIASTEERVAVEAEGEEGIYAPDVRLVEMTHEPSKGAELGPAGTSLATKYRLLAQVEPITERYIRVIEARSERLISVIDFISPANKLGAGLVAFKAKRGELLGSGVNFVEIDLVRRGDWRKLLRPHQCPASAVAAYRFTLRVAADPGAVHFEPIPLRDPLPAVPVPLRPRDPEVKLELQPLVERVYANGRYDRRLDYHQPCVPPLEGEDAAWADELLRRAGKR